MLQNRKRKARPRWGDKCLSTALGPRYTEPIGKWTVRDSEYAKYEEVSPANCGCQITTISILQKVRNAPAATLTEQVQYTKRSFPPRKAYIR